MKRAKMLQLAEKAGFIIWSDCEWKPKGATIDWSSNYDKELKKFVKLLEEEFEYERVANCPYGANLCGCGR
jgi:hypothetical protein